MNVFSRRIALFFLAVASLAAAVAVSHLTRSLTDLTVCRFPIRRSLTTAVDLMDLTGNALSRGSTCIIDCVLLKVADCPCRFFMIA